MTDISVGKIALASIGLCFFACRASAEIAAPAAMGGARAALKSYERSLSAGSPEDIHSRALEGQFTLTGEKSVPGADAPAADPAGAASPEGLRLGKRSLDASGSVAPHRKISGEKLAFGALAVVSGGAAGALIGLAFGNPLLGALIGLAVGAVIAVRLILSAD